MESIRSKIMIASIGDMYQQIKTLQALDEGVCIEIEFPAYNWTDQLASNRPFIRAFIRANEEAEKEANENSKLF